MATITKAAILSNVQARTSRDDLDADDIQQEIRAILYDICSRYSFLRKTSAFNISESTAYLTLPSDFIEDISVVQNSKTVLPAPSSGAGVTTFNAALQKVSMEKYLRLKDISDETGGVYTHYAVWNTVLYVYPKGAEDFTYSVSVYHSYEDDDEDNIELPECFKECIIEGVCWKVQEGFGLWGELESVEMHRKAYEQQLEILIARYKARNQGK